MNRHTKVRLSPELVKARLAARGLEPKDLASSRVGNRKSDRRTIDKALNGEELTVFSANKIALALGTSISDLQLGGDENSSFSTSLKINDFESIFPFTPSDHQSGITPSSSEDCPDFFKHFDKAYFWNEKLFQSTNIWLSANPTIRKSGLLPIERKEMRSVATPMTASGLTNVMDLYESPKFNLNTEAGMDDKFLNTLDPKPIFKSLPEVDLSMQALELLEQLNAFLFEEDSTSSDLSSFIVREKRRMMIEQLIGDLKDMGFHILGAQVGTRLLSSHYSDPYDFEKITGYESARWTRPLLLMASWSIKECSITYPTDALWQRRELEPPF